MPQILSGYLDLEGQSGGVEANLSPKVVGIVALCSGDLFATYDSMDTEDGLITVKDMESMLTNFADDAIPWAHFVYDTHLGDYRQYILPAIVGGKARYNNIVLRDLIMQADKDEDGSVNSSEFNATMWRTSFSLAVSEGVLGVQGQLQDHIVESLKSVGITDSELTQILERRNSSSFHFLREVSFGEKGRMNMGFAMERLLSSLHDLTSLPEINIAGIYLQLQGEESVDADKTTAFSFNRTRTSVVDGTLDMVGLLLQLGDEPKEDFVDRFQSDGHFLAATLSLRRALANELTGGIEDKPYEEVRVTSLTHHAQAKFDSTDWMADTEL